MQVTVVIGDPIHFDDMVNAEEAEHVPRGKLYDAVASRISHRLHALKAQVDKLAIEQSIEAQNHVWSVKRAADMVHQVDWDSFGMGSRDHIGDNSSEEVQIQSFPSISCSEQETDTSDWHLRVGFSSEGGIGSRIRSFVNPTELMGFAARGLFMNTRLVESPAGVTKLGPLRAWKQFLGANLLHKLNA